MDKGLIQKMLKEQALGAEEALMLDSALEGRSQESVRQLVAGLEDASPSMAWRSGLNQRLFKATRSTRHAAFWRFGAAATAVAGASLLLVSLTTRPDLDPQVSVQPPTVAGNAHRQSLEDTLLNSHQDEMSQASLGVYVSFNDDPRG